MELDPTHNAMRKKENPVLWVIPADHPFTGKKRGSMINSLLLLFKLKFWTIHIVTSGGAWCFKTESSWKIFLSFHFLSFRCKICFFVFFAVENTAAHISETTPHVKQHQVQGMNKDFWLMHHLRLWRMPSLTVWEIINIIIN